MKKRTNLHTSSAALFGTASELSRRGYNVGFTIGNTQRIDLFCGVPDGEQFTVQVKGITHEAAFRVQDDFFKTSTQKALYLVVVRVPPQDEDSPMRFFVMTHKEAKDTYNSGSMVKKDGTQYQPGSTGLYWSDIKPHEGCWKKLPLF